MSGIFHFHLIPLYWGSLMPKWKAVFPNHVKFSRNFGFLRRFLMLAGIIVGFLKSLFEPFIVLKTTVSILRFQCKNRFEKWAPLGWDIWKNKIWLPVLHWNCGIDRVVLSTIKGSNRVFKNQKILPESLKNDLKNPKLRELLIGKKGFPFWYMGPLNW